MSDAIVRLRVESQEYDSKLKRAAEGLTRYAEQCRKVGGTLEFVEDETLEYVKALGKMDTMSRTAIGSLTEMKKVYTEMAVQYKSLSKEEKNAPYGKAMAQSLEELKGRIRETKSNIDDVTNSMNGGLSRAVENITSKVGLNIKQITVWGAALGAGKLALDVAKDAFNANEEAVDDWARTIDAGKSMYEGFLNALNTGDISGYLARINDIVNAARTAYNELDRLGTMKTIQSPQKSAQQAENDRLRMMIQTGRYIAPLDGRKASMQNGQVLTPDQIKTLERQLQGGMQKMTKLVENEVRQSTRAINAVYDRQAKGLGLSQKEFRAGTSSMAEFDKRIQGYQQYRAYERQHTIYDDRTGIGHRDTTTNPYESYKSWGVFRVDGDRYNQLVQLIQQRDQQMGQAYGMQGQGYRAINRVEGITTRGLMGGGGGGNAVQIDTSKIEFVGGEGFKADPNATFQSVWAMMGGDEGLRKMMGIGKQQGDIGRVLKEYVSDPDKAKRGKKEKEDGDFLTDFGKVTNSVTNIASGLQSLGVEIPEGIAKTLGVIQTISGVLSAILAITTVISATSQANATANWVDAILPFANGGIVRAANGYVDGNTYSGDQIPALLNAGEVVLNRSQVGNLASQLSGGMQQTSGSPYVTGETIYLGLSAYLKSSGRGEIVTSRSRG